jgi:hypothetical protein
LNVGGAKQDGFLNVGGAKQDGFLNVGGAKQDGFLNVGGAKQDGFLNVGDQQDRHLTYHSVQPVKCKKSRADDFLVDNKYYRF